MKKYFTICLLLFTGCTASKSPKVGDCYVTDDRLPNMEIDKVVKIDGEEIEIVYTFPLEDEWVGKWETSELSAFILYKKKDFLELRAKTDCPW